MSINFNYILQHFINFSIHLDADLYPVHYNIPLFKQIKYLNNNQYNTDSFVILKLKYDHDITVYFLGEGAGYKN
ncbi:MAG TPA: hypothetical protein V6C58_15815 [Allocoleopsis sp.]